MRKPELPEIGPPRRQFVGAGNALYESVVTPMCNAMFALKGLNSIIIGPHPRSKNTSYETVRLMNEAIEKLGAPKNLIQIIEEPTVELSAALMHAVDVVVATGGMPMVRFRIFKRKTGLRSGSRKCSVYFDRGIDYEKEIPMAIEGRAFDNGIICSGEQTAILPAEDYDKAIEIFVKNGCYYVSSENEIEKLTNTLFPGGVMNKNLVGVSALKIAEAAGLSVPEETKVILVKAPAYGKDCLLSKEKMCPVISAYKYGMISARRSRLLRQI